MRSETEGRLLIFMHIPKTGGLTLRGIIDKQYNSDKIFEGYHRMVINRFNDSEKDSQKIKCIKGHIRFGIHHYFSKPYTYITMLRKPIERVISVYYYIRRRPQNPWYEEVKDISLKEFVRSDFRHTMNSQTLWLAGLERSSELNERFKLDNFKKAKENINKHFSIIGITEKFDESVFLMKKEFGWNDIFYTKRNVTKNRPSKEEVSKEVIDIIKERNKLDIELYEYAKQKLEKRINSLDTESRQKLDAFSRENKKNNDVEK